MAETEVLRDTSPRRVSVDSGHVDAHGHRTPKHIPNETLAEWLRSRLQQCAQFDPLRLRQLAAGARSRNMEQLVRIFLVAKSAEY